MARPFLHGVALYAFGMLLIAAMEASIKLVSNQIPLGQVWGFRAYIASIPILAFIKLYERRPLAVVLRTKRPALQIVRGLLGAATFLTFVMAVRTSELSAVAVFGLISPLIMVLLGIFLLGEKSNAVLIALCLSSYAAAFAMVPFSTDIQFVGAMFAFLSASCHALAAIVGRVLTQVDPPSTVALYTNIVAMLCSAPIMVFNVWIPMSFLDVAVCVLVGILGGGSYLCLAIAIKHVTVTRASVLEYTVYGYAIVFGWVLFAELPSVIQIASVLVISTSALISTRVRNL